MEKLNLIYFLLAYGGLVIHELFRVASCRKSLKECYGKKDMLTFVGSSIAIPILLVICTDTYMKEILPINYVTSFLAGYQTQSILKKISLLTNRGDNN